MAINTTTRQTTAFTSGNNFAFAFKVYEVGDVKVIQIQTSNGAETVLTITTNYTVTLNDDQDGNPGGTVTLVSSGSAQNLATGYNIVITSKVSALQQTEITNQGGFFPEVINDVFDKAVILDQQQQSVIDKSIRFPITQTVGGLEITENAATRANKTLVFDGSGDLSVSATVDGRDVSADGAKLDGIESGATADQTVSEIKSLIAGSPLDASHLAANSVGISELAANSVDSAELVDLSIDTQHIANEQVTTAKLASDAIVSSKLADNAVDSEHYVDGSVDHVHLANDAVDGDNIANDSINSEHYVDGSIDTQHIAADQITNALIADNQIDSEHYVDGSIDHVHLANDCIDGDNIQDDVVNSEHITAGALDNEHYAAGSITSDKLNGATVVTASEQASAASNDTSFLTTAASDARFFNVSTGDTIKDGDTFPDNDTTIATTAAINDRIIDLVDDVGGFVPIANETSFPTANPDAENNTGTVVSVKAASTNLTPSGTTVTIANGAGTGNTVTITGVPSVISSGFGFLVETTSTLHTYTFHRLVPKATEVTTVAGKATEIGRLGTAAAVEDMSILGTTDVVADLAILATTDVVADLNTLGTADVVADMNTLATSAIVSDMDTLADISANITSVANIASDVTAVAADASDIGIVAADGTDIGLVAGSITNVNTTASSITNVNTVATNISSVNNFANQYRIGSSNPTDSLDVGDLFFNTTSDSLKVYTGSAWVDGVTQTGNFALKTGNTFTGSNIHNDNVKSIYGTSSDGLEIFHNASDSVINDQGTGSLKLQTGGSTKIEVTSTGTSVTGNIIVSGNVDGRDVAADGTKLDGIESSATADQTASEIVALVADQTIAPSTIDMEDNEKIKLGIGDDLQIFHDGSNSYIHDAGTGQLRVSSSNFKVLNAAQSETIINAVEDGAVSLYYDNSKKLETTSTGVSVTGDLVTSDDVIINGTTNDESVLRFYDGGAGSWMIRQTNNDNVLSFRKDSTNHLQLQANGNVDVANGLDVSGNITVTGTVDGVDIAALNTTVGTKLANIVEDTSPQLGGTLASNTHDIHMADNDKLFIGTGSDMHIFHDGTNSYITSNNGFLQVNAAYNEIGAKLIPNGAVELYYDNVKTFYTKQNGVVVEGTEGAGAILEIRADQGDDNNDFFRFFADPSSSNLYLQNYASGGWETNARFIGNGATELWYDNVKKFDTVSAGVEIHGNLQMDDNNIAKFGSGGDLEIYHDGSNSYIKDAGTGSLLLRGSTVSIQSTSGEAMIEGVADGAVTIKHDNSTKFNTNSSGVKVTGQIEADEVYLRDSEKILLGTGSDLQIYHDGSHNIINGASGQNLEIQTNAFRLRNQADSESMIVANADGTVELYYNNVKKFETTNHGVEITGNARSPIVSVSDASNITIPLNTGTHFVVTLGGNRTFVNSNMQASDSTGSSGSIFIVQDGTGSRTAAFQSTYKFAGGTAPTLSTAANAIDRLDYVVRSTNEVHCVVTLDVK